MQRKYILILVGVFVLLIVLITGLMSFLQTTLPINSEPQPDVIAPVVIDQATKDRIIAELQKSSASSTISEKEKTVIIDNIQKQNQASSSSAHLDGVTKQNIIKSINPNYPN